MPGVLQKPFRPRKRVRRTDRFVLLPKPPFRLDLTVWALRRRPGNAVDRWEEGTYRRVMVIAGQPVLITVRQARGALEVTHTSIPGCASIRSEAIAVLERLLGLRVDLHDFYRLASTDSRLHELVRRFSGLKPPRFPTVFEALINGITCQQLSLTVGIVLLNRLVLTYGLTESTLHAFPRPEDLADVTLRQLRTLGYSHQKGYAILDIVHGVLDDVFDLEQLMEVNDAEAVKRFVEHPGVGRWTAEYVLLRGFGRTHIFPGDDVGARTNLQRWLQRSRPMDYPGVHRALTKWAPYGGLLYFHLLLDRLEHGGWLN